MTTSCNLHQRTKLTNWQHYTSASAPIPSCSGHIAFVPCQHTENGTERSESLYGGHLKSDTAQSSLTQGPELQNCDCIAITELLRHLRAANVPTPTSKLPLCPECGECRNRDCRASHLGKRMVQAVRRTLSGLGSKARKRRAVENYQRYDVEHIKASSPESTIQTTFQHELNAEWKEKMEAGSRCIFEAPTNSILGPFELCDNQTVFRPSCDPCLSSQTYDPQFSAQECLSSFDLSSPGFGIHDHYMSQSSSISPAVSFPSELDGSAQSLSGLPNTMDRSNVISRSKNAFGTDCALTLQDRSDDDDDDSPTSYATDTLDCDSPAALVDEAGLLQSLPNTVRALSTDTGSFSLQLDHQHTPAPPGVADPNFTAPLSTHRFHSDHSYENGQVSEVQPLPSAVEGLSCVCHGLKCFPRLPPRDFTYRDTPYPVQLQPQLVSHRELVQCLPDCYYIHVGTSILKLLNAGISNGKLYATMLCDMPPYRTALASLRSHFLGESPSQPLSILSILFLYAAIVTVSMDDELKSVNMDVIFAEGLLWSPRIPDPDERRAFEEIVDCLWLPKHLQELDQQPHSWTCSPETYCPCSLTELHETVDASGNLDKETAASSRLRTGRLPLACYDHIYWIYKLQLGRGSVGTGMDPKLKAIIASEVTNLYLDGAEADQFKKCVSLVGDALNAGQLNTVSDVKMSLRQLLNQHQLLEHQDALRVFSKQCNGAAAIHASEVVRWLMEHTTDNCIPTMVPEDFQKGFEPLHQRNAAVDPTEWPELTVERSQNTPPLPVQAISKTKTTRRIRRVKERRDQLAGAVEQRRKCNWSGCSSDFGGLPEDQRTNLERHVRSEHLKVFWRCQTCGEVKKRRDYFSRTCRDNHSIVQFQKKQ